MAVVIDEVETEVESPKQKSTSPATGNETHPGQTGQVHPKLDRYLRLSAERRERIRAD